MSSELYTVLALGMRYWFTFLGVLIVLRTFVWLLKDRRENHRRLRRLPDAGMIGELIVLEGSDQLPEGAIISVPREGVLGFNRTCDVVVPVDGVAGRHLDFMFAEQHGLYLTPRFRMTCEVDGQPLTHRSRAKDAPLMHGSTLRIGDALLRLRVFAGIDVAHYARMQEEDQPPQPQTAPTWQPPQWQPGPMPPVQGMPLQQPPPPVWFQPAPPVQQVQTPPPPEPVIGYQPLHSRPDVPPSPPPDHSFRYQPDAPDSAPMDDIEDELDDSFSAPVYPIPQPASTVPDYADDEEDPSSSTGRRRRRRAERRTLNEEE